jgi:hypothetical protein
MCAKILLKFLGALSMVYSEESERKVKVKVKVKLSLLRIKLGIDTRRM